MADMIREKVTTRIWAIPLSEGPMHFDALEEATKEAVIEHKADDYISDLSWGIEEFAHGPEHLVIRLTMTESVD
jgi:hypothetical protein